MKKWETKQKFKQLKNKLVETKKINLLNSHENTSKAELHLIKKANKSPKGDKNLLNKKGNIIELKNVTKSYVTGRNKHRVLNNISFEIKKGEFVVMLGESGSGKTTLLNVLSGLDRPTSGEIIIDNVNIAALKNKNLTTFRRNKVGFIFQSYNLLLELNAWDNVEMGRQLQIDNNKRLNLDELFERVGLGKYKKSPITDLSGGQLQRVSILRALSKNPKIICADEPTGALDSRASENIINLFSEINNKYGTTTILVTHNEQYAKYADRIIRVVDGAVDVQIK